MQLCSMIVAPIFGLERKAVQTFHEKIFSSNLSSHSGPVDILFAYYRHFFKKEKEIRDRAGMASWKV